MQPQLHIGPEVAFRPASIGPRGVALAYVNAAPTPPHQVVILQAHAVQ
jgi:hypothetical protein